FPTFAYGWRKHHVEQMLAKRFGGGGAFVLVRFAAAQTRLSHARNQGVDFVITQCEWKIGGGLSVGRVEHARAIARIIADAVASKRTNGVRFDCQIKVEVLDRSHDEIGKRFFCHYIVIAYA